MSTSEDLTLFALAREDYAAGKYFFFLNDILSAISAREKNQPACILTSLTPL